jgi:hypothetical protein
MNPNTNKWAVEVATPNVSEAIQRIAFSYGYRWPVGPAEGEMVSHTNARFLMFTPDGNTIQWANYRQDVEAYVNQIVATFDKVVDLFKNPPQNKLKVGADILVSKNGDVQAGVWTIHAELFDKLVAERAVFMGKEPVKPKLPVAMFVYTSKSTGRKSRNVLVTKLEGDSLEGLDRDDRNRYKKFLISRVEGPVNFVGFADAP